MSDLNARIRKFFDDYEKGNADFDVQKIAACYADIFIRDAYAGELWRLRNRQPPAHRRLVGLL